MARLVDVCAIQYGFPFDSSKFSDSEGMPLIRIRDVTRGYSETYTTESYKDDYVVKENDLLIGMDGEFNIAKWGKSPALLNQRVCRLFPKANIDRDYLYYFMPIALKKIESKTPFVTVKHLSAKELNKIELDVPPMEIQKKVASTMCTIDALKKHYEQQLNKLDELVKARFVEMFGDLVENPKQFPCVLLGSIMTVMPQNGLYKPQSAYVQDKFGTPILRIDGFYNGKVTDFNNLKRLCCTNFEKERYLLVENDIVINRVNSIEYLGKCARISGLQEDTVFESNMMRFHLDDSKVNSTYITTVLCSQYIYRQILTRAKKAVNQASINQGDVQSLNVVVPPLSLQNQFAAFVEEVDKSKVEVQKALDQTQLLFDSLMQQYFG